MNAVALRHLCFEDAGILEGLMTVTYVDVPQAGSRDMDTARDAELLIVLGGPIGVNDAKDYPFIDQELRIITERLRKGLPTLGICLGAQLIAAAAGGRVYAGHAREIGWGTLDLSESGIHGPLAPLADGKRVLHWHGDTFSLPDGAIHLAGNTNYANQAFSLGASLALQFHIEVQAEKLESWYVGHALEISQTPGVDLPGLRADAEKFAAVTAESGRRVIADWIAAVR